VITELVINHTSDQHPWFQRARRAKKGSVYRDYYVWNDDPDKYKDARIIFKDFEKSNWTWDICPINTTGTDSIHINRT
jgi:maltose alpha-D-glucosyltransferase / alpha-amylase